MVIELRAPLSWGGVRYALDFIEGTLATEETAEEIVATQEALGAVASAGTPAVNHTACQADARPWCIVEASRDVQLYLPSCSTLFRKAASEGRLFWMRACESSAPAFAQAVLESALCQGVLIRGLENFPRSAPAALWGRRWQLAARQGGTHLIWIHEKAHPVIGFDVRLEWTEKQKFEVKKGYGHIDYGSRQRKLSHTSAA